MAKEPRIDRATIGSDGMVQVYLIDEGKWTRRYPVDAKELVSGNAASLRGPIVKAVKGDEQVDLCPEQAKQYRDDGWEIIALTGVSESNTETEISVDEEVAKTLYNFKTHTVDELRIFAGHAGIAGAEGLRKSQLVAALSEWEPHADALQAIEDMRESRGESEGT